MEGSHSGLVRAPAKRLPYESGVGSSNLPPSAILASNKYNIVPLITKSTKFASLKFGIKINIYDNKISNINLIPNNSFEFVVEFMKA
jgi:hypothetical protein